MSSSMMVTAVPFQTEEVTAMLRSNGFEALVDASSEICVICIVFVIFWLLRPLRTRTPRRSKKTVDLPECPKSKNPVVHRTTSETPDTQGARPTGKRHQNRFAYAFAAVARDGRFQELPALVEEARAQGVEITSDHLMCVLRSCVKAQQFAAGLAAYEALAGLVEDRGDVCSILLFCAVEVGDFRRCPQLYGKLCASQSPSGHDFVNIVRCYARTENVGGLRRILDTRARSGSCIDLMARNRAIGSCAEVGSLEMAQMVFDDGLTSDGGVDVVSYNTLIKAYARAGKLRHCFQILQEMEARSVEASELTFGIMLEACVTCGDAELMLEVFGGLRRSGTRANAVHYTALIKGLAAAGRLAEAKAAFAEMRQSERLEPDVIAYSTLMKALCDARAMTDAVELLELMLAERVRPDTIVFHNIFLGFHADGAQPEMVLHVFELIRKEGVQPTASTLSIFLKCLAGTGFHDEALAALESVTQADGGPPEARLYAQLAWDCIRSRCGAKVVEVYKAMARSAQNRGEVVAASVRDQLVMRCVQGGMPETAEELHTLLRADGGDISKTAARTLASVASRGERSPQCGRSDEATAPPGSLAFTAPRRENWRASPGLSRPIVSLGQPRCRK